MDNIQKNENKNKKPVIRYLIYILLVTIIVVGVSFSRYATTLSGKDTARVASFEYEITGPATEELRIYIPIYATAKLSVDPDDDCMFDDDGVSVIREVNVTNKSEVAVRASISAIADMSAAKGIVWCIFDQSDTAALALINTNKVEDAIIQKLKDTGYTTIPPDHDDLVTALIDTNQRTITGWNNNARLGIGTNNTRKLTVVFWAEHDGIMEYWPDTRAIEKFDTDFSLGFTVTQID